MDLLYPQGYILSTPNEPDIQLCFLLEIKQMANVQPFYFFQKITYFNYSFLGRCSLLYLKIITYRLTTPRIFFFCMADTTPALNRSEDKGAWMIWVSVQPVLFKIS